MRLLMLDLDPRLIAAVSRTLRHHGVSVVGTQCVETAQKYIETKMFDAALLDCDSLTPPDLQRFAGTLLILTTSFLEHEGEHRFFGHAALLRKPFTSAQLLSTLRETLGTLGSEPLLLVDVLRRAHTDAESVGFCVGDAELFLERGELVHAQFRELHGEPALAEVLAEPSPRLLRIPSRPVERTIHRPFQTLMLDILQRIEEREQGDWGGLEGPASARTPRGGGSRS
jgi:DNA-binding response OmpR family regulator